MTQTKEITNVPGLEAGSVVVIKKLGYGSLNKLRGLTTKSSIDPTTKQVGVSMDLGAYMKWLVIYGIVKAPFFSGCKDENDRSRVIDKDELNAVSGEFIYKQIEKFNGFAEVEETKKNLD